MNLDTPKFQAALKALDSCQTEYVSAEYMYQLMSLQGFGNEVKNSKAWATEILSRLATTPILTRNLKNFYKINRTALLIHLPQKTNTDDNPF